MEPLLHRLDLAPSQHAPTVLPVRWSGVDGYSKPGGGAYVPSSRATAIACRSWRYGATTCAPTGSPAAVRPIGGTADGSPAMPMSPVHDTLSRYCRASPLIVSVRVNMSPLWSWG